MSIFDKIVGLILYRKYESLCNCAQSLYDDGMISKYEFIELVDKIFTETIKIEDPKIVLENSAKQAYTNTNKLTGYDKSRIAEAILRSESIPWRKKKPLLKLSVLDDA